MESSAHFSRWILLNQQMFNIDIEGKTCSGCLPSPLTSEARGQEIQEQALSAQSNKYPTTLRVLKKKCNQSMSQMAAKSAAIDLQRPGFSLDGVTCFFVHNLKFRTFPLDS